MSPPFYPGSGGGGPRVGVVEDYKTARTALEKILSRWNYDVFSAETGEAAVAALSGQNGSHEPVLFLMDLALGKGIDGVQAAEEIQRINPLVSFLFVTGKADETYRRRAREGGFEIVGWVDKPVDESELRRKLERGHCQLWVRALRQTLPPEVIDELRTQEVGLMPESADLLEDQQFLRLVSEIDHLYERLGELERNSINNPATLQDLADVRAQLRELEEREADEIEVRYLGTLAREPEEQEILARADRLLADSGEQ